MNHLDRNITRRAKAIGVKASPIRQIMREHAALMRGLRNAQNEMSKILPLNDHEGRYAVLQEHMPGLLRIAKKVLGMTEKLPSSVADKDHLVHYAKGTEYFLRKYYRKKVQNQTHLWLKLRQLESELLTFHRMLKKRV